MNFILTPQGHTRSHLIVPIESPGVLHISALGVQPRICHRFRDISSHRILTVNLDPSGSSKVKFDGAKLGAGLQQAPLRHPAKFQPDRENGVRDVRYRFFSHFDLGG